MAVRGVGDVGSAVAHRLFQAGYRVWISDDPAPAAPRRGMAFADAAFEGSAELEGVTATVVIETRWGDDLGKVLTSGRTKELAGEPRNYGGHARERFIYTPAAGVFRTGHRIADRVEAGEVVAYIGGLELKSPLAGILRGLVHDGVTVPERAKVVEVDPRCDPSKVLGIGERPGRIAEGVLEAIKSFHPD